MCNARARYSYRQGENNGDREGMGERCCASPEKAPANTLEGEGHPDGPPTHCTRPYPHCIPPHARVFVGSWLAGKQGMGTLADCARSRGFVDSSLPSPNGHSINCTGISSCLPVGSLIPGTLPLRPRPRLRPLSAGQYWFSSPSSSSPFRWVLLARNGALSCLTAVVAAVSANVMMTTRLRWAAISRTYHWEPTGHRTSVCDNFKGGGEKQPLIVHLKVVMNELADGTLITSVNMTPDAKPIYWPAPEMNSSPIFSITAKNYGCCTVFRTLYLGS